jgi:hypothetical protein
MNGVQLSPGDLEIEATHVQPSASCVLSEEFLSRLPHLTQYSPSGRYISTEPDQVCQEHPTPDSLDPPANRSALYRRTFRPSCRSSVPSVTTSVPAATAFQPANIAEHEPTGSQPGGKPSDSTSAEPNSIGQVALAFLRRYPPNVTTPTEAMAAG